MWGHRQYDTVEQLLIFFIKQIFGLPQFTPRYLLHLETDQVPLFTFTLRLHFKYILKGLNMPDRLPNILAKEIIRRQLFRFNDWQLLAERCAVRLSVGQRAIDETEDQLEP